METRYPIRKANGKDFDSQEDILALLRQEKHGHWLSGTNDMWHGGIHISRNTAPWSVVTPDTCDGAVPLQCIASGELVAWRVCQDYVMGNLGDKPLQCSPSFLLVRSVHKPTKDPSTWLCFYTLYMHLAPLASYPKWTVYQVTPKGNGLIMRQYSGSEVPGQTAPPEVSHKARLHSGEQVLIERQETFLLHNGQAEVFGLAQRLKDGAPVGDKFWTSARPAYVEPIGEQYGYLPGWMAVALKKGQFDTVVCPSAMTAIKAGDAIGFLGKEEVPDEFSNVTADWFSHIEVLSNDGRMPLFLNNPAQLHTGRQFLLVPEGKQLYQREEKSSSPAFEPVGLTNKGDAADIIPAESATSATDSASVAYLQIRPGTWIRKDDVETVSQNDLAKLKFKAVGQVPVRNQLRSLETQWVIDAFRWLGSQLWAGRDLESGQLQAYYTRMADELEKVNTPENIQNENRDSVSDMLRHRNQYVDFFLRRLVVKHESEWHGGSKNPKWNGVLATMTGESLAYVQQWLDAHEWMSQVPEFSKDEAVWHFHPVEFLTVISFIDHSEIDKVLLSQYLAIRNRKTIYNKAYPQLEIPREFIYRLSILDGELYILYPLDESLSPVIPSGKLTIVVLAEEPGCVYAFQHSEILSNAELRNKASGPINFGHSSLAYKNNGLKMLFESEGTSKNRLSIAAKSVLIAGHAYFPEDDNPILGGGVLIYWNNDSGHYKPTEEEVLNNRAGYLSKILPMSKFRIFEW
ncbi:hypothetical protein C3Z09_20790 [Lelliottia aquatilis]|uniref:hypothetical protein n=1 Tax=Lelliottia aquatilis TaxID=2080838 RepID=UPI000CDF060A|nr:hypothetical protein [Lelliottia aquatilis]POZ13917.1 hypothetical protein C3Z09_20790 [Lelliottia aquatilis]